MNPLPFARADEVDAALPRIVAHLRTGGLLAYPTETVYGLGSRARLPDLQALATKAGFGTPQRVTTGLDHRRLALLLAVLERRGGLPFGDLDVFVNVTGGVRLVEPSTDLAVMAALVSSVANRPVPADALFLGEVGLGGEIRPVAAIERRLAEAARQGFRRAFVSARSPLTADGIEVVGMAGIGELAGRLAA